MGNVIAMVIQQRQGVPTVLPFVGDRWRETMLYIAAAQLSVTAMVLYTFALRNVFCPVDGGEMCGCSFAHSRADGTATPLSAFCCQ